jgi:hypothetical protein
MMPQFKVVIEKHGKQYEVVVDAASRPFRKRASSRRLDVLALSQASRRSSV